MLRSFLIGLVAGQRGMTPLAVIATATRTGTIAPVLPLQVLLQNPLIAAGTAALAAAEMVGDKMKTAPDRIIPIGLATRSVTAAYAGATLAPANRRALGAAVAVGTALASSYVGWRLRCAAMPRSRQAATGFMGNAAAPASELVIANPVFQRRPSDHVGVGLPIRLFAASQGWLAVRFPNERGVNERATSLRRPPCAFQSGVIRT